MTDFHVLPRRTARVDGDELAIASATEAYRQPLSVAAPVQRFPTTALTDYDSHARLTTAVWRERRGNMETAAQAEARILAALRTHDDIDITQYQGKSIIEETIGPLSGAQALDMLSLESNDELIVEHSAGADVRLRIRDVIDFDAFTVGLFADVTEREITTSEITPANITGVQIWVPDTDAAGFLRRIVEGDRIYTSVGAIRSSDLPQVVLEESLGTALTPLTTEGHFRSLRGRPNVRDENAGRRRWQYPDDTNPTETVELYQGDYGYAFVVDSASNDDLDGRAKVITAGATRYLDPPQFNPSSTSHTLANANAITFALPTDYVDVLGSVDPIQVGGATVTGTTTITNGVVTYTPTDEMQSGYFDVHGWDAAERRLTYRINILPKP